MLHQQQNKATKHAVFMNCILLPMQQPPAFFLKMVLSKLEQQYLLCPASKPWYRNKHDEKPHNNTWSSCIKKQNALSYGHRTFSHAWHDIRNKTTKGFIRQRGSMNQNDSHVSCLFLSLTSIVMVKSQRAGAHFSGGPRIISNGPALHHFPCPALHVLYI